MSKLAPEVVEEILQNGQIYEVGGAVRDRFLGLDDRVKDRDYLVTGIPYDNLAAILKRYGRVDLVGKSFGVIKFTHRFKGQTFTHDIALPRKEFSTGSGHKDFKVDFDPFLKVEDDLVRRDFTINAMALALGDDKLIDPLNGRSDLDNRVLRMTSENSFPEDPLRMLRAVQLSSRFNLAIEDQTLEAMKQHAPLIQTISAERIAEELNKLLTLSEKPSEGFRLMQQTGLLKEIMPELENCVGIEQPGGYHKYDVFEHTLVAIDAAPPDLIIRLSALFHDITKPIHKRLVDGGATFYGHDVSAARVAKKVLTRLRYSNEIIKDVQVLVERHMFTTDVTDKGLRRLIRRVGQERIFKLLDLRRADVVAQGMGGTTEDVDEFERKIKDEIDRKPPFGLKDLAIDGNEIMTMFGLKPGPEVGWILNYLLEKALDEPSLNTREQMTRLAREHYEEIKAKEIESNNDKEDSQ